MWFHYTQNNSGGHFDFNRGAGITHHVVIEADSAVFADNRAQNIGLYFNGAEEDGPDCPCCGNRWSPTYDKGSEEPQVYGEPVDTATHKIKWMGENPEVAVHPKDSPFYFVGESV